MNPKNYKMYKSSGFPLKEKKLPKSQPTLSTTYALLPSEQPLSFEVHSELNNVLIFDEHEYIERQFSQVFNVENEYKIQEGFRKQISQNLYNFIVFPVLQTQQANRLIFPKKKSNECLLKQAVETMIQKKKSHTIITLSILGVKFNGALIDELNFEWLEEQESKSKTVQELANSLNQKEQLKISKLNRNQVKAFELNRQEISSWEEAKEIFSHYRQVSDYMDSWSEKNDRNYGQIFQIAEVEVDNQDGSILQTYQKTIMLKVSQFLKGTNLMLMRIGQAINDRVNGKPPINTRDYPLMLFLSQCFESQSAYKFISLSQIGRGESLKEESVNLSFNLKLPGSFVHVKNYCDNKKKIEKVKRYAKSFTPLSMEEKKKKKLEGKQITNKMNIKLIEENEKVTSKQFFYETVSSSKKRMSYFFQPEVCLIEKDYKIQSAYESARPF